MVQLVHHLVLQHVLQPVVWLHPHHHHAQCHAHLHHHHAHLLAHHHQCQAHLDPLDLQDVAVDQDQLDPQVSQVALDAQDQWDLWDQWDQPDAQVLLHHQQPPAHQSVSISKLSSVKHLHQHQCAQPYVHQHVVPLHHHLHQSVLHHAHQHAVANKLKEWFYI